MEHNYEILGNIRKFEGNFIKVNEDKVKLPDGREAAFEIVLKNDATAIVPINENGEVIFVRQYRHAVLKETLEIPAGNLEKGEDPKECAIRELEEETSFKAGKLDFIFTIYPAIGFCNEKIHVYLATNLTQGNFNFDDNEFITIEKYPLDEAINLIYAGEIVDSKTICSLLAVKNFLNTNES